MTLSERIAKAKADKVTPPKPVQSPFTRRALAGKLPAKVY